MNNNLIKYLLLVLFLLTVAIIAWDFLSKRPERNSVNPWEYNVDEFINLEDTVLIKYDEILNLILDSVNHRGIAYLENRIYIIGDNFLQVVSPDGKEYFRRSLMSSPGCITVSGGRIFIAYATQITAYDMQGELINSWDIKGENAIITSMAVFDDLLFAADAGNRRVLRYKTNGDYLGQFEGKSETGQLHGFIIPSSNFDLDISDDGDLWVVNPGKHALEHYSHDGYLKRYWESTSFSVEGFSGCCNPVHIAILSDGSFVTSEKGIVRIKVHKPFGEVYAIVAPPLKFRDAVYAPDLAVSPEGLIYALDFNTNRLRVFKHR